MTNTRQNFPAVILTGGLSTRMGRDKFLIDYGRGVQWRFMYEGLQTVFGEVYISCREDQFHHFPGGACIADLWTDIGPMGAIASILEQLPESESVFVVACDLPFFEPAAATAVAAKNDPARLACCAKTAANDFPDPLAAVWNRCALAPLKRAIAAKEYSLQKLLRQHPHNTVEVVDERWLFNANTEEEASRARSRAGKHWDEKGG